ncbi:MAG: hypothetical protein KIS66_14175 [Fimbriimonadaceae bacterium]|nr:hypothetical protein [Fimbriimonadaceae bacterium]
MRVTRTIRRGGVLLSVLAFAAITSLIMAAVGMLVLSHLSTSRAEAGYAKAISVAEAGANYELEWIGNDPNNPNRAHQHFPNTGQPGVVTLNVPGGGTATVGVKSVEGGNWLVGSPVKVVATGTVDGVSRTVEVLANPVSVMAPAQAADEYAVFGLSSVRLNGAGSRVTGSVGTNETYSATGGAGAVSGNIAFGGVTPSVTGPRVYRQATPYAYPTVSELARRYHSAGMTAWKTQNNNDRLLKFNPNNTRFLLSEAVNAGYTKSSWTLSNSSFGKSPALTDDGFSGDRAGGGRYSNASDGLYGKKVLIFPPGDYYFESIGLTSNQSAILVDNASGPVRIWIGGNSSGDSLHVTTLLTNPSDPGSFRVLYAKSAELSVTGTAYVSGVFYAVDDLGRSSIKLSGNSYVNGMLIANDVTISGNSEVGFPTAPLRPHAADPARAYRYANQWRELDARGRPKL